MAFDLKQSMKLGQQLLMTPQLQQAIKLLQLSRLELEDFVTQQLVENPTLEEGINESMEERIQVERERDRTEDQVVNERMGEAAQIVESVGEDKAGEMDWETFSRLQDFNNPPSSSSKRDNDDEFPSHENLSKVGTLQDHLLAQIGEMDLDELEKDAAALVIGNIDDRGYLQASLQEMADKENLDFDLLEDMLDVVQHLDPCGVGAKNLKECLHLQLRAGRLKNGIVEHIIDHYLVELETRNFQAIAKAMKISIEQVIENVHIIAGLEPIPGRQFGLIEAQYVVPDVYVFKVSGEWIVTLNDEGMPNLKVSKKYEKMADKSAGDNKDYLQEKLKAAHWLIKSIQQRQKTILRVTEKLVERQNDFFEKGAEHLKPMVLRDIADDIGMHESTISRVTSNKFVHTPQGIFELKYFFNSSVSMSGGDSLASASVKKIISDIIGKEDPRHPLADQKIVEILEDRGIQLARRTVAKYREQLGILPSSKRKKYF